MNYLFKSVLHVVAMTFGKEQELVPRQIFNAFNSLAQVAQLLFSASTRNSTSDTSFNLMLN